MLQLRRTESHRHLMAPRAIISVGLWVEQIAPSWKHGPKQAQQSFHTWSNDLSLVEHDYALLHALMNRLRLPPRPLSPRRTSNSSNPVVQDGHST